MFKLCEYCFILFCKVSEMCIHMLRRPYNLRTTRSPEGLFVEAGHEDKWAHVKAAGFQEMLNNYKTSLS